MDSGQHLLASLTHDEKSLCLDDELAPSTNEDMRQAVFEPRGVLVSQSRLENIEQKVSGHSSNTDKLEDLCSRKSPTHCRSSAGNKLEL